MDDPTIYLRENGRRGGLQLRILDSLTPPLTARPPSSCDSCGRPPLSLLFEAAGAPSHPWRHSLEQIDDLPHEPRLRGAVWIPDPSQDPCALLARSGASYSTSLSLAMCDDVASDSLHRGCDFGQRPGMQGHVRVCGVRVGVPAAPCGATASTRTRVNPIQAPAPSAVRASAASARFRRGRCSYAPRASPLASLARFLCLLHATFATPGVLRVTRNAHGFVRIRYNYGFLHTAVRLYLRPYTTCKLSMGPTIHIFSRILVAFSCHRRRRRPDALIAIVRMRISEHVVDHDGGNGLGLGNYIRMSLRFLYQQHFSN
ncbi:hypothetical protein B0H16DRAFT_1892455 [Mycena metata]|uniref:Uncharacterized protein n=1 Tax=Mycena metata TaxID=1033252 RepID=A0AAD7MVE1_9AGAR|nr:hypothetical protein B0H16DRAFT_1892455 [Mycena metata]